MNVDTTQLQISIRKLMKVPKIVGPVIKDESRRLLEAIIAKTPPKTLAQGRAAIGRDFDKAVLVPTVKDSGELSADTVKLNDAPFSRIRSKRLRASLARVIKRRDYPGFRKIISRMHGWEKWNAVPFSVELHKKARDKRGRVRRSKKVFTLDKTPWSQRRKQLLERSGWMKASWNPALIAVGGTPKGWTARHGNASGGVVNMLGTDKPHITVRNSAPGIPQLEHIVRSAIRTRTGAIERRIKGAMKALAAKATQ